MNGKWNPLLCNSEVLAVHAALVRTREEPEFGEIIMFSGSQFDQRSHGELGDPNAIPPIQPVQPSIDHCRLYNCRTGLVTSVISPTTDVFCCGHAFLPDGRLLIAGGTELYVTQDPGIHHDHWPGTRNAWVFDPAKRKWYEALPMSAGRWYPTLLTLASGEILAMCGHVGKDEADRHYNNRPSVFSANSHGGNWRDFEAPETGYEAKNSFEINDERMQYPRLHLLPNGKVYCSTPTGTGPFPGRQRDTPSAHIIDPNTGARAFVGDAPARLDETYFNFYGTSVLLPLLPEDNYRPRVLLCGGKNVLIADLQPLVDAINNGEIRWSDGNENPSHKIEWKLASREEWPLRHHLNAVLLPTGEVFVCGGITPKNTRQNPCDPRADFPAEVLQYLDAHGTKEAKLYRPMENKSLESAYSEWEWITLPAAQVIRNYHSVALLMPDGRVWTAGSNRDHCPGFPANAVLDIEIFEPWYYTNHDRPSISSSPRMVHYGRTFTIHTTQAATIKRIAAVRAGSVTHAFNSDQRYVGLKFAFEADDRLRVTAPPIPNVAPPGQYLFFVINQEGVPSEGKFLHLWEPWFAISPLGTGSAEVPVTALWNASNPNHLDVFVTRADGMVMSSYWEPQTSWVPWFGISEPGTSSAKVPVTALWNASNPNHLDVFVTRADGMVMSSYWEPQTSWVPWFGISEPGTSSAKVPVTALWNASNPNHLDVFVTRADGMVMSSYWEPQTSWVPWLKIGHPIERPLARQRVAALWSRHEANHLDLFVTGQDGTVWSIWWGPFVSGW